jgi:hypothetical protein
MKVLLDENNIVVAKSEIIEVLENGFKINDTIYMKNLVLLETDLNPEVQKEKIINGEIVINENYISPEEFILELERIRNTKLRIQND